MYVVGDVLDVNVKTRPLTKLRLCVPEFVEPQNWPPDLNPVDYSVSRADIRISRILSRCHFTPHYLPSNSKYKCTVYNMQLTTVWKGAARLRTTAPCKEKGKKKLVRIK